MATKVNRKVKPDNQRRMISIQSAAEQYEISPRTIYRWIADGRLTAYRLGPRMIRLDADEVRKKLGGEPVTGPLRI
jgi:excisionase family DNA binding protein